VAARLLAERTRYENPEEAFLAGLMHDLGKPVMLANIDEPYTLILNDVYRGVATFHEAEMQEFGFSHQHVGALVAEKWKFPPQLCEAIGHHHTPLSAPSHTHLASVIGLANQMMVALEIGFEKNKQLELEKQPTAVFLDLGKDTLEEIAREVRSTLAQMPDPMKY
jgi:putative nucleotidyltransferase with HDIG domain